MAKREEKYTDPERREKIKEEIKASDKGGEPGQWSARKSQLLVKEYEKAGGRLQGREGRGSEASGAVDRRRVAVGEGEGKAREGGETKRYLPKKA